MLITPKWGMRLIASCEDMSLMPTLLVDGVIEQGLTNWLIANRESLKDKHIIDVGANIGYFTVLLGCLVGAEGRVVAYEANPDVFKLLKENIYLGQLHERTILRDRAVSKEHNKLIEFHASKKYQGNSSIKKHSKEYENQFATDVLTSYHVESESLDHIFKSSREIELVKIDTEGAELEVFKSMEGLLGSNKVKHVVFELNKNMLQEDTEPFYSLLLEYKSKGALFYTFTPEGQTVHARLEDLFQNNYIDNILMKMF